MNKYNFKIKSDCNSQTSQEIFFEFTFSAMSREIAEKFSSNVANSFFKYGLMPATDKSYGRVLTDL